jgi:hypothetical protein
VLRGGLTLTAIAALLLVAPASEARRAPTSAEQKEIAEAAGLATSCATAFVSTVDPRFGSVISNRKSGCPAANAIFAVRRTPSGFEVVNSVRTEVPATCPSKVPRSPGRDLQLCRAARTYLLCRPVKSATTDGPRVLSDKPSRCSTLGPGDTRVEGVNLAKLKWRGWGSKSARSSGVSRGFHKPFSHTPIRVRAYRLRRCSTGDSIYTRLKTSSKGKTRTFGFPASCSDQGIGDEGGTGSPVPTD